MHTGNPFATEAFFDIESEELVFKCPSCSSAVRTSLNQIDPLVGVHVACPGCRNIAHVLGSYKVKLESVPSKITGKITGGVSVAIAHFSEWYFGHPQVDSLIKAGQSDLLIDYGLWAFCAGCYHQYTATALIPFILTQRARGLVFMARTPESAKDMQSLTSERCLRCSHKDLIVIVTEIPGYVCNALLAKRKTEQEPA